VTVAIVPDANVLYSFIPRDLFMQLRFLQAIHLHWTDQLSDEWTRNLAKNSNQEIEKNQKTVTSMEAALPDARVDDYEQFIPLFPKTDPKDQHVAAAAKRVQVDYQDEDVQVWLVTWNLNDFDTAELAAQGIRLCTPDQAFSDLLAKDSTKMLRAVFQQMAHMKKTKPTFTSHVARLPLVQMGKLATALAPHESSFPKGWPGAPSAPEEQPPGGPLGTAGTGS
jgi:hypothetical protein